MGSKDKNLVIVRAVTEQGMTQAQAAAKYGVSRQWVHTLLTRYQTEGPDGATPRSRAPKTRPGTTSTPRASAKSRREPVTCCFGE